MTERRTPLSELFEFGAASAPDKLAVADGAQAYTYRELRSDASRVAALLARLGVQAADRVMVLAEKSALMPALAGAIWKLGALYVPVDSANPPQRNAALAHQVKPKAVLGSSSALHALGAPYPALSFEAAAAAVAAATGEELPGAAPCDEAAIAYIMFTSGSTGAPKGVMISHGSLLDYFRNHNRVLRFSADSRVLSFSPFHFDVSIEDTLLPLSLGAFVFQFRGLPVGDLVRQIVLRERITHLIAVSTLLTLITGDGRRVNREWMPHLTMVMTGAEVCDPKVINLWKKNLPEVRVINAYGPTEATIVCLTHTIEAIDEARDAAYPIGRPLQGVEARIVDAGRVVTLPGEAGELWIGGSQVMSGYLDAPAETARRIVEQAGVRYYRTGDICRYTETGEVEFVGRRDDEVKLAGRRIHLGELRQLALSHPAVGRAAAGLVDVSGRKRIALIVISEEENAPCEELLDFLGMKLPAYMRPQVLASAHSPCVSSTGKTDERQLFELLQQACARYGADRYAYSPDGQFLPAA